MYYTDFDTWFNTHKVLNKDKSEWIGNAAYKRDYLLDLFEDDFREVWDNYQQQLKNEENLEDQLSNLRSQLEEKTDTLKELEKQLANYESR